MKTLIGRRRARGRIIVTLLRQVEIIEWGEFDFSSLKQA